MKHPLSHPHQFQKLLCPGTAFCLFHLAIQHRQLHIFQSGGPWNQIICLKHKADLLISYHRQFFISRLSHISSPEKIFSLRRAVQRTNDIHQRGFTGTGFPHDGYKFALLHLQVNPMKNFQFIRLSDIKSFYNPMQRDYRGILLSLFHLFSTSRSAAEAAFAAHITTVWHTASVHASHPAKSIAVFV